MDFNDTNSLVSPVATVLEPPTSLPSGLTETEIDIDANSRSIQLLMSSHGAAEILITGIQSGIQYYNRNLNDESFVDFIELAPEFDQKIKVVVVAGTYGAQWSLAGLSDSITRRVSTTKDEPVFAEIVSGEYNPVFTEHIASEHCYSSNIITAGTNQSITLPPARPIRSVIITNVSTAVGAIGALDIGATSPILWSVPPCSTLQLRLNLRVGYTMKVINNPGSGDVQATVFVVF